jgi:hypothetical protein
MLTTLQFVLSLIVAYSGLYAGVWLGTNSPEEIKPGKKYLLFCQKTMFCLLLLTIVYLLKDQWLSLILLGLTYVTFTLLHKRWELELKEFYLAVTVIALMVSKDPSYVYLFACVIFMYGMLAGSLLVEPHIKHATLLLKRRQLFYKAFNMTADFITVLSLVTVAFVFGNL